jgi:hypothetical protein
MSGRSQRPRGAAPSMPPRRGVFDAFLAPRAAPDVPMPTIRTSFGRGVVTVLSAPILVIGTPILVFVEWLAVIAAGFQGPFAVFVHALALPPIGTLLDVNVSGNLFPGAWAGLLALAAAIVIRAVILAIVAAVSVQVLRDGGVGRWVWVPALRALPASLAVSLASLSLLFVQAMLGAILGGGIGGLGQLLLIGGLVLGVSYFGFAPAIAASEDRRLIDTLTRAWRAARLPGSGNLTLAVLYVVPSFALLLGAAALPGGQIGVNPSVGAWVLVLLVNMLHVAVGAMYAFRYLSIAEGVPEAPARRAARRG